MPAALAPILAAARRAPFYARHGATLDRVAESADLSPLPFATKDDFRADFQRFLTGEPAIRVHTTSGSTGTPAIVAYSVHEIVSITERAVETMRLAGVEPGDRVLNLFGYGTFIAGNLYDWGATSLGTLVIPFGSAAMTPPTFAAVAARALAPDVVNGVPSYLLRFLGDLRREDGKEIGRVRILQCAGEVLTAGLRARLQKVVPGAGIFDQYGMTEFGPLAAECAAHDGMHLLEDGLHHEIVDDGGHPVTEGEGELVVTGLKNRAMVLLRYRTGDHVTVQDGVCPCGRRGRRIRVLRRADDLTKIRGVLCAKNDLIDAVRSIAGSAPFKIEIHRDDNEVDRLRVTVAGAPVEASVISAAVREALKRSLRLSPDQVEVQPEVEVPRTVSGKPQYVEDRRVALAEPRPEARRTVPPATFEIRTVPPAAGRGHRRAAS